MENEQGFWQRTAGGLISLVSFGFLVAFVGAICIAAGG